MPLGLGLASSHAPGMWRDPEDWPKFFERMPPEIRKVTREQMRMEFDFDIQVGSSEPLNEQAEQRKALAFIQAMQADPGVYAHANPRFMAKLLTIAFGYDESEALASPEAAQLQVTANSAAEHALGAGGSGGGGQKNGMAAALDASKSRPDNRDAPTPGRTWSSRTGFATQSSVRSVGKAKSGGMTPMISFTSSDTKCRWPTTAGLRLNQVVHSVSLMSTTLSSSPGRGSRPSCGRTPNVAYMSFVAHAIPTRSARSGVRSVDTMDA